MSKYQSGDKVHPFLTFGSLTKKSILQAKNIVFLAEGTIHRVLEGEDLRYGVRIDKIFLDITDNLFPRGQISVFASLWVERGEEAWKLWNTPSNRFAKVE